MIRYLGNYPKDRENGMSEENQGVATDGRHWFFTQRDRLWRIPLSFDLNRKVTGAGVGAEGVISAPMPEALKIRGYNHYGDLDHYRGLIFVAVEGPELTTTIAVFRPSDLSLVKLRHLGL